MTGGANGIGEATVRALTARSWGVSESTLPNPPPGMEMDTTADVRLDDSVILARDIAAEALAQG